VVVVRVTEIWLRVGAVERRETAVSRMHRAMGNPIIDDPSGNLASRSLA
jgi:hypothetical protein